MHSPPSIFLDTNVLKASVDTRLVLPSKPQRITWGDRGFDVDVDLRPASPTNLT
jgi:hypothetical protein